MSGETTLTIIGNLTAAPELRFTPKRRGRLELHRGLHPTHPRPDQRRMERRRPVVHPLQPLAAAGRRTSPKHSPRVPGSSSPGACNQTVLRNLRRRKARTFIELELDEIGPSLRYAKITKTSKNSSTSDTNGDNPWNGTSTAAGYTDEPPF